MTVTKKQLQSIIDTKLRAKARKDIQLKKYAVLSINHMLKNKAAGLFLAPSRGKTLITLFAFYILRKRKEVDKLIDDGYEYIKKQKIKSGKPRD